MKTLLPVQNRALEYARQWEHPALFLEMRLGKTLAAIRIIAERFDRGGPGRGLVVAPISALPAWREELLGDGETSVAELYGDRIKRYLALQRFERWSLVNWDGLRVLPELVEMPWNWVILDESLHIRNPKSQISRLILSSFHESDCKMLLCGLPDPEDWMDFFNQFKWLDGEMLGYRNWWRFRNHYFRPAWKGIHRWTPRRGTLQLLRSFVRHRALLVSASEAGLANRRIYMRRWVEQTVEQTEAIEDAKRLWEFEGRRTIYRPVLDIWLSRISGGYGPDGVIYSPEKTELLVELLMGELRRKKVVVWFRFNEELRQAESTLRKAGIGTAKIVGSMAPSLREESRHQLLGSKNIRALLVQIKCCRYGADLSAADTAIYYSCPWSANEKLQTEARICHPLAETPRLFIHFITRDSGDEDILNALAEKRARVTWLRTLMERFR